MADNTAFREHVKELKLTQTELAHRLNSAIEDLTGRYGTISERTIYEMLSGRSRWPHKKHRLALEAVFGCTAEELGFRHPSDKPCPTPDPEEPVRRRTFLTSATITAATSVVPVLSAIPSVGTSDVLRLRTGLEDLTDIDAQRGGHNALEQAALVGAERVLQLQKGHASERVHKLLYAVAADYTAMAAFSCIDARSLDRATLHLNRAAALAGLSQDSVTQLRVWNLTAMLASQRNQPSETIAAAHAAGATRAARRDSVFASLAHARAALGYSASHDRQAALRSLGYARETLSRATDQERPRWIAFYGPAEVGTITAIVHQQLEEPEYAEAAWHQALATIPPHFRRNQAQATAGLAVAQLSQGDAEQACASAHRAIDLMAGNPVPGRMRTVLGDFHRTLINYSPHAKSTHEWTDRVRQEWSR